MARAKSPALSIQENEYFKRNQPASPSIREGRSPIFFQQIVQIILLKFNTHIIVLGQLFFGHQFYPVNSIRCGQRDNPGYAQYPTISRMFQIILEPWLFVLRPPLHYVVEADKRFHLQRETNPVRVIVTVAWLPTCPYIEAWNFNSLKMFIF